MKDKIIISLLIASILTTAVFATRSNGLSFSGVSASKCSTSSTEVATVGHQVSSTLLSANETRAYARIQVMPNATNTTSISFDEGAAAVLNEGASISGAGTTTMQSIEFGRNTDFPYTGAVTGLNNVGSSTVLVTECSY